MSNDRKAIDAAVDKAILDLIGEAERVGYQTGFTHPTTSTPGAPQ